MSIQLNSVFSRLVPWLLIGFAACTKKEETDQPTIVTTFRETGLDVHWDPSGSDRIAYSIKESDTYYDIHTALPDGSNDTCLTCNNAALPNKHIACPSWDKTGQWIIFVAEKPSHPGSSTDALPGFGAYCDIWLMNAAATRFYKLVDIPNNYDHGVIAPRFSPDGRHIVWADRKQAPNVLDPKQTLGYWVIKLADFNWLNDSTPVVDNYRTFEPGGSAFYETYGFSPDGSKIIFCSSMNQPSALNEHIYTIDTLGSNVQKLTEKDYNEHAFYTPDGGKIAWMSNTQATMGGTDWWMMNSDGSNKKRLTYFNEPNYPQYAGHAVWAGLGSFSPQGNRFVGGVQQSLITQEGKIVLVEIK